MENTIDMPLSKQVENQLESKKIKTMMHEQFNYVKENWKIQPDEIYRFLAHTSGYSYNYVQRILAEKRRS